MLNMNPGLKDITYSITGGSIKAQGGFLLLSLPSLLHADFSFRCRLLDALLLCQSHLRDLLPQDCRRLDPALRSKLSLRVHP
jgi:hypothetical protein